jgi:type VI secretion system protein ImpA
MVPRLIPFDETTITKKWPKKGAGESLQYSAIFDQIKDARTQEDDSLSQGIWQRELKRADWLLVERLCGEVLTQKSKDLRVLGWLLEAWIHLDGMEGFDRGLAQLTTFSLRFWDVCYPVPDCTDDDPFEERYHIFAWLKSMWLTLLALIPLTPPSYIQASGFLTLSDWRHAINLETVSKRAPDGSKLLSAALQKGQPTLQIIREHFKIVPIAFFEDLLARMQSIRDVRFPTFLKAFKELLPNASLSFRDVEETLREITTTLQSGIVLAQNNQKIQPQTQQTAESDSLEHLGSGDAEDPLPPPEESTETPSEAINRKNAYKALHDIGTFLEAVDPHSLTPHLLLMISRWEGQTLPQILANLSKESPEVKMVLKMMVYSLNETIAS